MSSPRSKTRTALYRLARQTSTRGATGNTRGASYFFLSWSQREKSRLALARRFLSQLIFSISNHSRREQIATRLVLLAAREGLLCLELFSSAPETLFLTSGSIFAATVTPQKISPRPGGELKHDNTPNTY